MKPIMSGKAFGHCFATVATIIVVRYASVKLSPDDALENWKLACTFAIFAGLLLMAASARSNLRIFATGLMLAILMGTSASFDRVDALFDRLRFLSNRKHYYEAALNKTDDRFYTLSINLTQTKEYAGDGKGPLVAFDWGRSGDYSKLLVFDPTRTLLTDTKHRLIAFPRGMHNEIQHERGGKSKIFQLDGDFYSAYISRY